MCVVVPLLFVRNPVFYWFRPFIGRKDPYDLAAVYAEFQVRAKIAQGMADKDANDSGFIGPDDEGVYELRSSRNLDVPSSSPPPSPPNPLDGPAPIALDAAVLAALQQASLDPDVTPRSSVRTPWTSRRTRCSRRRCSLRRLRSSLRVCSSTFRGCRYRTVRAATVRTIASPQR